MITATHQFDLFRPTLIGCTGLSGSGKSEFAKVAKEIDPTIEILSVADPLKEKAAVFADMQEGMIHQHKVAYRGLLQDLGVAGRIHLGPRFWLDKLERRYDLLPAETRAVVDDIRYLNEADWVIKNGGLIVSIKKMGQTHEGIPRHESEQPDKLPWGAILLNDQDQPEEFRESVKALLCGEDRHPTVTRKRLAESVS